MSYNSIEYHVQEGLAFIRLNRPDVFNAFNNEQSYELLDALGAVAEDQDVRAVVLTGNGKAFCSGQDLKAFSGEEKSTFKETLEKKYNPIIRSMRNMDKPIIGSINGVAAGAGCSLALVCDYIIASDKASFMEAFVHVGLVLDSGSSYFLPRAVGSKRAFELATMGSKLSAEKALEWGMINQVVPHEDLEKETLSIGTYYANGPSYAIGLMKRMLNQSGSSTLNEMLEVETDFQDRVGKSDDHAEGMAAFKEKRKAKFTGR
jgi:2-(1,2-epoxy-1,2-dihydrophenyl)acetyl-CoA isomerase